MAMKKSVQEALKKLAKVVGELNEQSEELNRIIVEYEDALKELQVGVRAIINFPQSNEQLRWEKLGGREWGLVYAPTQGDPLFLRHASRIARMRSLTMFTDLTEALTLAAKEKLEDVRSVLK